MKSPGAVADLLLEKSELKNLVRFKSLEIFYMWNITTRTHVMVTTKQLEMYIAQIVSTPKTSHLISANFVNNVAETIKVKCVQTSNPPELNTKVFAFKDLDYDFGADYYYPGIYHPFINARLPYCMANVFYETPVLCNSL